MTLVPADLDGSPAPGAGDPSGRDDSVRRRLGGRSGGRGSWRVPLRMARRTAWRERGRALMVVLLIALPVAAVAGGSIAASTGAVVKVRAAQAALGHADARLKWVGQPASAVNLLGAGDPNGGEGSPLATLAPPAAVADPSLPAPVRAGLPAVRHSVARLTTSGDIQYADRPYRGVVLVETRLSDPVLAGTYTLTTGRLPAATGEAVVSTALADRIGLRAGSQLTVPAQAGLPATTVQVVGVYADVATRVQDGTVLTLPGTLHLEMARGVDKEFWVTTAAPVTFDAVLRLAEQGWQTTSRSVLAGPPAGCAGVDDYCDSHGVHQDFAGSGFDSGTATVVALATVMALLQVVLLVGPAFAVGLRRRRRDLGLLAVSGARPGQLRRVVLAEGLVLGTIGAAVGIAVGWVGIWALRGVLASNGSENWLGLPVAGPLVLVVAAFGLVTAVVAAAQPARQAARTDPASALGRGAAHLVTREGSRRVLVLGALSVVIGTAVVVWVGLNSGDGQGFHGQLTLTLLLAGSIAAELGVVALTPTIVALVARLAARLPLAPRLALRDAARNRLRSGAAVAAVTAAVAAATAAMLYTASSTASADRAYRPQMPIGAVRLQTDLASGPTGPSSAAQALRTELGKALPLAKSWAVPVLPAGIDPADPGARSVDVVLPASGRCPAQALSDQGVTDQARLDAAQRDPRCSDPRQNGQQVVYGSVVGDGDLLAALTGVDSPQARQVLAHGGVVVFSPYQVDAGMATLEVDRFTSANQDAVVAARVSLPAVALDHGFVAGTAFLSPAAAARLGAVPTQTLLFGQLAHPVGTAQVDAANAAVGRLLGQGSDWVTVEQGRRQSTTDLLLTALVIGAALVAAAAAITAGGLALADSKGDLATLAAVGAAPRVRRRLAAAQAGVLTLIGCVLGAIAGLLPGWAMVHSSSEAEVVTATYSGFSRVHPMPLAVPWGHLLGLAVGLPLLTALVVGVAVRSRIPLNRRVD